MFRNIVSILRNNKKEPDTQYLRFKTLLSIRFLSYVQGVYIINVTTTYFTFSPISVHLAYMHLLYFNKVHFQYVTENVTTFVIFGHGIFYVDIIK